MVVNQKHYEYFEYLTFDIPIIYMFLKGFQLIKIIFQFDLISIY